MAASDGKNAVRSDLDFTQFKPVTFEFQSKAAQLNMREPQPLLDAVKTRADLDATPASQGSVWFDIGTNSSGAKYDAVAASRLLRMVKTSIEPRLWAVAMLQCEVIRPATAKHRVDASLALPSGLEPTYDDRDLQAALNLFEAKRYDHAMERLQAAINRDGTTSRGAPSALAYELGYIILRRQRKYEEERLLIEDYCIRVLGHVPEPRELARLSRPVLTTNYGEPVGHLHIREHHMSVWEELRKCTNFQARLPTSL